jgi:hypothetical protein
MRSWKRTLTGLALLALFVSVETLAPLPQFHHDCNELGDLFAAAAAAAGAVSTGHPVASSQLLASDSPFDCPACMLLGMALVGSRPLAGVGLPAISSRTVSRPARPPHVSIPRSFEGRAPPAA